jgi:hypothetical protein
VENADDVILSQIKMVPLEHVLYGTSGRIPDAK